VFAAGMGVSAAGRAQRLVHDLLDGANAATALRAATEAAIDLAGAPRVSAIGMDRAAHIVVTQDVAGTNYHETEQFPYLASEARGLSATDIEYRSQKQKQKRGFEAIPNCPCGFDFGQGRRIQARVIPSQPGRPPRPRGQESRP
jgi:hypothetical protein